MQIFSQNSFYRRTFLEKQCYNQLVFEKKRKNIWLYEKKVVPLHAFSAFGLQSSAVEGTDDTDFGMATSMT